MILTQHDGCELLLLYSHPPELSIANSSHLSHLHVNVEPSVSRAMTTFFVIWTEIGKLMKLRMYPTCRKCSLDFNFRYFVNGKFAKFEFRL